MLGLVACRVDVQGVERAFYDGDGRKVHCAVNLDHKAGNMSTVDSGLDRARDRGEVIELYGHRPGGTIDVADIEYVLAGARDRGLAFYTYGDFAAGRPISGGIAFSFDDFSIFEWHALRPLFDQYDARITFFLTRYQNQGYDKKLLVKDLADDGHDIAAHGVAHLRAPTYVEENGLAAYMKDEAVPSIQILRDDGYDVTSFAYPFGARTSELDDALLEHVALVRSVAFTLQGVADPCP
ncbi:MAG: polysaccharide deacetylase family protein [Myxococcota bacterium]|nr:polysaccharide deacetylase family protein [Myxococcota bacterium]